MAAALAVAALRVNGARAAAAAAFTPAHQAVRHMGIFENVMDGYQSQRSNNQEKNMGACPPAPRQQLPACRTRLLCAPSAKLFKAQMEYFQTVDKYDMAAHIVSLRVRD